MTDELSQESLECKAKWIYYQVRAHTIEVDSMKAETWQDFWLKRWSKIPEIPRSGN